jgi:hypothetical protein
VNSAVDRGRQARRGAEGFVGLQRVGSDEGPAVFAPERMVACAFNQFALTSDRESDRAAGLVQEGACDDSAKVAVSLRRDVPCSVQRT